MEDPVVPLDRNLYGHPVAGLLLWERHFEKNLLEHGWEKFQIGNVYSLTEKKGLFLSVYVNDFLLAGEKQKMDPMWNTSERSRFGEPTSSVDHVYLGCTQRECQISKDIVDNYSNMFGSKISAGTTRKLRYSEKLGANIFILVL